jgi:hypothetical protein
MRNLFVVVLFVIAAALIIFSFSELETIARTLQNAHLRFFILGLFLQLTWFVIIGRMYKSIYKLLAIDESTSSLVRIAAAANFVNVVAPTAGMGGIALFASEARRHGHAPGRATVAAALFFLFDQAAFICILALGFLVLIRRNDLEAGEITAAIILLSIFLAFALVLYLGYRSEKKLGTTLASIARGINRISKAIIRRDYLSEQRAYDFAREIADGLAGLSEKPQNLVSPILWGLLNKSLLMAVLSCAFLSFEVPFSAGTIVAGFALAYLFFLISPTPSGIGVVEGLMPVALSSLRVDWSQAVIVTLTYRAITFWFPLGVGALSFRALHRVEPPAISP